MKENSYAKHVPLLFLVQDKLTILLKIINALPENCGQLDIISTEQAPIHCSLEVHTKYH